MPLPALRIGALPTLEDTLAQVDAALATPAPSPTVQVPPPVPPQPAAISPEVAAFVRQRAAARAQGAPVPQATDDERPPDFARRVPVAEGVAAEGDIEAPRPVPKWKRLLGGLFGGATGRRFDEIEDRERAQYERAIAKRGEDPSSAESKAAQSSWAPYLRAGGWTDNEIGRMSANQLKQINISGIVGARQERQAKEAEAARQAEAQRAELEERRAYEDALWQRHNEATSQQAMDRTRLLAGMTSQRMSQAERDRIEAEERAERNRIEAEERAEKRRIEAEERKARTEGRPDPETYSIPGTEVVDAQRFRQVILDDTQRRKLEDEAKANATIREGTQQMLALLDKHGTTVDDPEVIASYDTARNLVRGGLTVLGKTGALQEADIPRYASSLPDITLSKEDAYRLIPGGSKNPKADAVRGFQSSIDGVINASLASSGLRLGTPGQATKRRETTPKPGKGAAPGATAAPRTPPKPGMKLVRVGQRRVWVTLEGLQQMIDDGISAEVIE